MARGPPLRALSIALACTAAAAALAALPAASADVVACVPPDSSEAVCVFAVGHAQGEGRCGGFAHDGGTVGVMQRSPDGDRSAYVQNGCYDSEDQDGSYHGSFIGLYMHDSSTGEQSGYHWNAGTHEAYGDYCTLGAVDPDGQPRIQCPPLVGVPVFLDLLL